MACLITRSMEGKKNKLNKNLVFLQAASSNQARSSSSHYDLNCETI